MKRLILVSILTVLMSGCAINKPQQFKFTNGPSHASVTGACTIGAIYVLRQFNIPSPWNEIGGAVACTSAMTVYKEAIKDPVFDWGDALANTAGAATVGATFLFFEW